MNSPVVALLASETLQVVDVGSGSHDHLESGNLFGACRAETRTPE